MGTKKRKWRKWRKFSAEFKAETVRLVRDSDKSVTAIARELDLTDVHWELDVRAGAAPLLAYHGDCLCGSAGWETPAIRAIQVVAGA